ncbi:hypothetical protein [Fluviispira multicolorata]|uniref:Lipoprotein SmpA/OmlA domain-containing protein n=1 Tax=Fluviispira multicolorata TaxID=2654512 RepID=A0A833N6C4_9BACT|nr:hypothetical protein [Fluviispira multicolorata]KAB8029868.1 hypothetical protein GCL57_10035 [Fluviispira multicolorata]
MTKRLYLILSFLISCASFGKKFNGNNESIKINVPTRKEVESNFGIPFRSGFDSGLKIYHYFYGMVLVFNNTKVKELTIRFNENDIVQNYSYLSSFNDDNIVIFN